MQSSDLCDYCRTIEFEALRRPWTSEVSNLGQKWHSPWDYNYKLFPSDTSGKKFGFHYGLGSLNRIKISSQICPLCKLILQSLIERTKGQLSQASVNNDIQSGVVAAIETYGVFSGPADTDYQYYVRSIGFWLGHMCEPGLEFDLWKEKVTLYGNFEVLATTNDGTLPSRVRSTDGTIIGPYTRFRHALQPCETNSTATTVCRPFDTTQGGEDLVFGGRKRPLTVNLRWLHCWLDDCIHEHGNACDSKKLESAPRVSFTRMIDTTRKCIVKLNDVDLSKIDFAILSYVWGKDQKLKLLSSNEHELEKFESLTTKVPSKTISDAIDLAKWLQIPYIWVDALCISQDDDEDKAVQVGAMGLLYNAAIVTIVAAAGEDSNAGLPGLRPATRFAKQQEVLVVPSSTDATTLGRTTKGISLMTTLGPYTSGDLESHNLTTTKWGSRGWTMQEQYVSRRNLIFTDEQVWWSCSCATWCEEAYFDLKEAPRFQFTGARQLDSGLLELLSSTELRSTLHQAVWDAYRRIVTDYTHRSLSYHGDIFDAFSAILKAFQKLAGQSFLWGLPRSRFEAALRWERTDLHYRRTAYSTLPMGPHKLRLPFPSWSWMGWIGQAEVAVSEEDTVLLAQWPEVICYVLRTVPFKIERVENQFNGQTQHSGVLPDPGTPLRAQWKPNTNLEISEEDVLQRYGHFADESYAYLDEGILFFWTSCAEFAVELDLNTGSPYWHMILNCEGRVVRKCERDFEVSKMSPQQPEQRTPSKSVRYMFIVLGSRSFDPGNVLLDVMQIGWHDGLAYRIDTGHISEEAWVNEKPIWKLIALA